MSIHKVKVYNRRSVTALNEIDNILAPAKIFAKSYGLQPFKIITIEDENIKVKLLPEISDGKINQDDTQLIVFAIKPVITNAHINDFFTDIKASKKITGHSLSNYRRHIEGLIQNNGDSWTSKQAHIALHILSSSAKQAGAELTVFNILNTWLFDKELELEKEGFTTRIAVKINLPASKNVWAILPENKN
jgi:nitroreductase